MRRRSFTIVLSGLILSALLAAGACESFDRLRLEPELQKADQAFDKGDFAYAAARYASLSDRFPESAQRQTLMIRQGQALYKTNAYHEARNVFLAYLREYPTGAHMKDARVYLTKIDALMTPDNPARQEAIEAAKKDLTQLEQLRLAHPHDPSVIYAIGNLYYEMGNHKEAIRNYYEALSLDAAYKEKALIKQRMTLDANGQPHPLTPDQMRAIERENRPLAIFDVHDYTARDPGDNINTANQKRFFNVTGLVRNQSQRMLRDVTLEVSFMNAQRQVLDTQVVTIGSMGPEEVRAFLAIADNYDDLYNITSHEIIPRWERERP